MSQASENRRALVTGGSGYFGCTLVRTLRERGYAVRVLDLLDVPDRPSEVEFVRGDIRDPVVVRRACEGVDVVHHNVAQVPLAKDAELFQSVNVGGIETLLAACRAARVPKVVNVSSSAVFGVPSKNPVDATVAPRPREAYGRAKLEAERVAERYVAEGMDVTTIRPRTILGHGRLGIFQVLFELVWRERPVYVLDGGHNRYQFVHADDLASACILAGERPGPAVLNIGASRFGTIRQLVRALIDHAGSASPIRSLPMRPASWAMRATGALGLTPLGPYHALMYGREMFFDLTPARELLGWEPRKGNEEMICESYDDYVRHRADVLSRTGASHHRSPVKQGILRLLMHLP